MLGMSAVGAAPPLLMVSGPQESRGSLMQMTKCTAPGCLSGFTLDVKMGSGDLTMLHNRRYDIEMLQTNVSEWLSEGYTLISLQSSALGVLLDLEVKSGNRIGKDGT